MTSQSSAYTNHLLTAQPKPTIYLQSSIQTTYLELSLYKPLLTALSIQTFLLTTRSIPIITSSLVYTSHLLITKSIQIQTIYSQTCLNQPLLIIHFIQIIYLQLCIYNYYPQLAYTNHYSQSFLYQPFTC